MATGLGHPHRLAWRASLYDRAPGSRTGSGRTGRLSDRARAHGSQQRRLDLCGMCTPQRRDPPARAAWRASRRRAAAARPRGSRCEHACGRFDAGVSSNGRDRRSGCGSGSRASRCLATDGARVARSESRCTDSFWCISYDSRGRGSTCGAGAAARSSCASAVCVDRDDHSSTAWRRRRRLLALI